MILFTADIHLKLGQKNVPVQWAKDRYYKFFSLAAEAESGCYMHIVGGDLFDHLPSIDELGLYFEFVKTRTIKTIIYPGNHEADKKTTSFLSKLKDVTSIINPLVSIIDCTTKLDNFYIVPYGDIHKKNVFKDIPVDSVVFTHVRGEIPPHVKAEIDLDQLAHLHTVFAGDLHSHSNTQRNIVYPGSPMTTSFHRELIDNGYLLINEKTWDWKWYSFPLPQLIRKTVTDPNDMLPTKFHHTIYELEGDIKSLANTESSELLDKRIIRKNSQATLNLHKDSTITEELVEYFSKVLKLDTDTISKLLRSFHDYSKNTLLE
jgi:DNA repair exonuclease SbcCD nuclease subunit